MASTVVIVVVPDVGDALDELTLRGPVWLAATDENRVTAHGARQRYPERSITTFTTSPGMPPESQVLAVLGDVELHHGPYSQMPPWDRLEIQGASLTSALRSALEEFGITSFRSISGGFQGERPSGRAA
jgi:hypothetical protein